MLLSFHRRIRGDVNLRLPHKKPLSPEVLDMAASARAVILTQHVKANQYRQLQKLGTPLFPNYTFRFGYEGKVGNIRLFRRFEAPHPKTHIYESVLDFENRHMQKKEALFDYPFVLKGDRGGGGWAVFLLKNIRDLRKYLRVLADVRLHPTKRFISQEYVQHGGRDLRVVVVGDTTVVYWRCQERHGEFRNNVGRGAAINYELDPPLRNKGIACVRNFCSHTGINLAAFDVLFDRSIPDPEPMLSEINFLFGRKGLGGSPAFHKVLQSAVGKWFSSL